VIKAQSPIQNQATSVARLAIDPAGARRVADLLAESLDPTTAACAALEQPDGRWQVEVHFRDRPDMTALRSLVALAAGQHAAKALTLDTIAARDWVKASLDGLPPVMAGRFVVHGAHDRARVPAERIDIEIEAGLAFGTGHHGTTRGCLLALDGLLRIQRPRHLLDIGTGTGVLAIAAARALQTPVLAIDIDPRSVQVARANARANRAGSYVTTVHASGVHAPQVVARAPFDLVFANILLSPLRRMAAPIARSLSPNAHVILSGLLNAHANAAIAAYRMQGLTLERRIVLEGWTTLVMKAMAR
jgi:ribosomal protein L11 methyltransferase